jgi:betaine-aldehyde dehydrogenase
VLKPPEDAPLSLLHLGKLFQESGLPDGVVNILPGLGTVTGDALTRNPGIDKISFTGGPRVGRQIGALAAQSSTPVTLELGVKSPQVILPAADVDAAIQGAAMGLFTYQETCAAGTRILVHRSLHDRVVEGLAAAAEAQVLGDPFEPTTTMGALVNARQQARVLDYIGTGREDGAGVVAGARSRPARLLRQTHGLRRHQRHAHRPGGDLRAGRRRRLVSTTPRKPSGWRTTPSTASPPRCGPGDVSEAHTLARRLRAGGVAVDGWSPLDPALPWGGVKASGIGRELGWSGIVADTEEKTVTVVM